MTGNDRAARVAHGRVALWITIVLHTLKYISLTLVAKGDVKSRNLKIFFQKPLLPIITYILETKSNHNIIKMIR